MMTAHGARENRVPDDGKIRGPVRKTRNDVGDAVFRMSRRFTTGHRKSSKPVNRLRINPLLPGRAGNV